AHPQSARGCHGLSGTGQCLSEQSRRTARLPGWQGTTASGQLDAARSLRLADSDARRPRPASSHVQLAPISANCIHAAPTLRDPERTCRPVRGYSARVTDTPRTTSMLQTTTSAVSDTALVRALNSSAQADMASPLVLIIDDDATARLALAAMVGDGYRIVFATS